MTLQQQDLRESPQRATSRGPQPQTDDVLQENRAASDGMVAEAPVYGNATAPAANSRATMKRAGAR